MNGWVRVEQYRPELVDLVLLGQWSSTFFVLRPRGLEKKKKKKHEDSFFRLTVQVQHATTIVSLLTLK